MLQNNFLLYSLLLVGALSSCIRPYEPEILAEDEMKYVITGQVTDEDGSQTINISVSSAINNPHPIPAPDCQVTIFDDQGHSFPMNDEGSGVYKNNIDLSLLLPGIAFRIEILTPSGDMIVSSYDTLPRGPDVDSVYWERESQVVNSSGITVDGIQFYVNLDAASTDSRYYRWDAIETYEYHSLYPLEWYYDGEVEHVTPPDSSRMVCWKTKRIPDIFTLPTDNLAENKYDHYSLHFVNNLTTRLAYGYSLLVRQFAMSREAFTYYDNLRVNSNPQGGLYDKQPLAVQGNLYNVTHPDKEVLGFFAASAARTKRIFVYPIPDLMLNYESNCDPIPLRNGLKVIKAKDYPAYLLGNEFGYSLTWMDNECVDCLALGGINVKPSFWPF